MDTVHGMIFDIQHFSLHDGPGVRSTVFFKGCPLACAWCANPESQSSAPQLLYFRTACTGCGSCVPVCPNRALAMMPDGLAFDRHACTACGACVPACPNEARQLSGRIMSIDEITAEVRQHWRIFAQSGGGVTCGGGEALAQADFLHGLLKALHEGLGFHTCLDTSGLSPWPVLERILPHLDLILLDLKHMDNAAHKRATGVGNGPVLANARALAGAGAPVLIRVPLVPGFNDTDDNLDALGLFLKQTGLTEAELMPYHTLGVNKYRALGLQYAFHPSARPRIAEATRTLRGYGVHVRVHGDASDQEGCRS